MFLFDQGVVMIWYMIIRVVLWLVGVGIALFPTLNTVGISGLSVDPYKSAVAVNLTGQFRDFVFVIVIVSVLGISVIIDFLFVKFSNVNQALKAIVIILMIGNILALGSGLVCFLGLPSHSPVGDLNWLNTNYYLILTALTIGFLTEIVISIANYVYE